MFCEREERSPREHGGDTTMMVAMSLSDAANRPKLVLVSSTGARGNVPPKPLLDDAELLAALRRGDSSAATSFHDRVRPLVDKTVRRLIGAQDSDREDLAQQAMIELVYTIDRYRGECSLDAWVATISAHVVYKHIRKRQSERRVFGSFASDDLIASVASPKRELREVVVRGAMTRVVAHLEQMDPQRAWAFVLHDVCGYDLKELAHITQVTVAAAQTRLVRGRKELHQRIGDDPELANMLGDLGGNS